MKGWGRGRGLCMCCIRIVRLRRCSALLGVYTYGFVLLEDPIAFVVSAREVGLGWMHARMGYGEGERSGGIRC